MSERTEITLEDLLRAAWAALLRGDLEERDRLCAQAEKIFAEHGNTPLPGNTNAFRTR
jgi:hypothetical protein